MKRRDFLKTGVLAAGASLTTGAMLADGNAISIAYDAPRTSALDVPFTRTKATTRDILNAVRDSRRR